MQVSKWGNSLAIRIPQSVVEALELKEGDEVEITVAGRRDLEADSALCAQYSDRDGWARKAILNIAASGPFSSDETISRYATDIWKASSYPVPP